MTPDEQLDTIQSMEDWIGLKYLDGQYQESVDEWSTLLDARRSLMTTSFRFLMHGWCPAIGHNALIDFYVKLLKLGLLEKQIPIVMPRRYDEVANRCFLEYWKEHITVITNKKEIASNKKLARFHEIPIAVLQLKDGRKLFYNEAATLAQELWEQQGREPLLKLTEKHTTNGYKILKKLGVPYDAKFVCLHIREPGFHKQENDHFRSGRNAGIGKYLQLIEMLTYMGFYVIRLGDETMKVLPKIPKVIDYAHCKFKSDWMDIFLLASCSFYIGTNSGVSFAAGVWGAPCLYTDWMPLGIVPWHMKNSKILFKNYSRTDIPEVQVCESKKVLAEKGVTVTDNTPEQLCQAAADMMV